MNRVLVIGATGNIGRHVVSQLIAAGETVRAMLRDHAHADLPQQVEVVRGDLTSPETLDACLDDVDAVFLVWVAPPAAVAPAIERVANPICELHSEIERLIESSGLRWSFLRPGMLAVNARNWWAPQIRAGDVVRWPYLAVPTSPIDERDIAAVAVRA